MISPESQVILARLKPRQAGHGQPSGKLAKAVAVVVAVVAVILPAAAPAAPAHHRKAGWGPRSSFIGRYHLRVVAGGSHHVRGGELTMFIQEEFPGSEEPAGILKLRTRRHNDVVYLTALRRRCAVRTAVVKGGSFLGPTIGGVHGTMRRRGRLRLVISTRGLGKVRVVAVRYSRSPTP